MSAVLAATLALKLATLDSPTVYTCPEAEPSVKIDGGYIISDARAERLTCQLTACEMHVDSLLREQAAAFEEPVEPIADLPPSWQAWTMGIVISAVVGAVFGIWIGLKLED